MTYLRLLWQLMRVCGLDRVLLRAIAERINQNRPVAATAGGAVLAAITGGWALFNWGGTPEPKKPDMVPFVPAANAALGDGHPRHHRMSRADHAARREKYFRASDNVFSRPRPLRYDPWVELTHYGVMPAAQRSASDEGPDASPSDQPPPDRQPSRGTPRAPSHVVGIRPPVEDPLGPVLPAAPKTNPCCDMQTWAPAGSGPNLYFGQGKYVSPERTQHVPVYRLRPGDRVECVFRITRDETNTPYQLNVGDQVRIESLTDRTLDRDLEILNDGTITLRLLGRVHAARLTVDQLQQELEDRYKRYYRNPEITVTPLRVNTRLQDIINSVDSRAGLTGGQVREVRVTPDGTVSLPAIGSVPAQGLSLDELKQEIDARYAMIVQGLEITPILIERAPRYVYVLGEVRLPGRYELTGPTTVMQALAMAGGIDNIAGSRLNKVVILRRDAYWRLIATHINLWHEVTTGQHQHVQDLWVADSDVIVVPKTHARISTDFIGEIFTRGIYGVMPFQGISLNFAKMSTL
mgnify:CR=1 FL=1